MLTVTISGDAGCRIGGLVALGGLAQRVGGAGRPMIVGATARGAGRRAGGLDG